MKINSNREENKFSLKVLVALLLRTLYGNNHIVWLGPLLFVYGFILLIAQDVVGSLYVEQNIYNKWYLIPIACLLLIELLNQFSYWYAKYSRQKAIIVKAVLFWFLFSVLCISGIIIRLYADEEGNWSFSDKWSAILLYFCISWILPAYSFCPDIRFYLLYGRFEKKL